VGTVTCGPCYLCRECQGEDCNAHVKKVYRNNQKKLEKESKALKKKMLNWTYNCTLLHESAV
jgi:hypothetical protein